MERVSGIRALKATALAAPLAVFLWPASSQANAQGTETLAPCLDPALIASQSDLIAAFRAEGWQDAMKRDTDRGAWFKDASMSHPKKFWNAAAANKWKRDISTLSKDYLRGYEVLSRGELTLVFKGLDSPLGNGPAHCMLIAQDLDGQDHETTPEAYEKPKISAYLWSKREIDKPDTFKRLELFFSTLEPVEGERFEMLDIFAELKD